MDVLSKANRQVRKENGFKENQRSEVWSGFMFFNNDIVSYHQASFKKDE